MGSRSLTELIVEIETSVGRVLKAVRAFAGTDAPEAPAKSPAVPVARFGEHERLEESKYYPPSPSYAPELEEGGLPESSGETRVVLLVVNPYLVHAYWEVAPDKLREAQGRIEGSVRAVLRFYEASGNFDVDIDLEPRNWYVPLWSAGKSYHLDLGLRGGDESFVPVARSNVVHTPRALPTVEVGERFLRVAAPGRRQEITPPPYRKPRRPRVPLRPLEPVFPAFPAAAGPSSAELAETPSPPSSGSPSAAGFGKRADSAEILRRKLAEFYALREWRPEPLKTEEAPVRDAACPWAEERNPDLTELAEQQQAMGLSSSVLKKGRPEH